MAAMAVGLLLAGSARAATTSVFVMFYDLDEVVPHVDEVTMAIVTGGEADSVQFSDSSDYCDTYRLAGTSWLGTQMTVVAGRYTKHGPAGLQPSVGLLLSPGDRATYLWSEGECWGGYDPYSGEPVVLSNCYDGQCDFRIAIFSGVFE